MSYTIDSFDGLEPALAREFGYLGSNPAWTCVADNRFSYFLYIPKRYYEISGRISLIVPMHGSGRNAEALRGEFSTLAEEHSCAVLAPLFPAGMIDPNDTNNYKMIKYQDIRYDQILLAMVEETRCRFGKIDTEKIFLSGFSGGGQFVHRFTYLHPERVQALACGAPGTQTFLDLKESFPQGVKDMEQIFSKPVSWDRVKAIPTMFFAGDADTGMFHALARGRSVDGPAAAALEGGRYGQTVRLERNWRLAGANCFMHSVPGASHEEHKLLPAIKQFFEQCLLHKNAFDVRVLSEGESLVSNGVQNLEVPAAAALVTA